jgi:hypothetical protein
MPRETILRVLHEALTDNRSSLDELVERLIEIERGKKSVERTEQVIALGFLVCARALRESSLMQEIAVREELQDLHHLVEDILVSVRHTEQTLELDPRARLRRREERDLAEDLLSQRQRPS